MRWNDFPRSLLFAAAAAAGAVAVTAGDRFHGLALYISLAIAVYLVGIADRAHRGVGAALLAGSVALGVTWLSPHPRDALLAGALMLGLCRSGLLYRRSFARALALEGALLALSVGALLHLFAWTPLTSGLAVWGFFLVQSAFFLVAGAAPRRRDAEEGDAFEAARARLVEILDHGGA